MTGARSFSGLTVIVTGGAGGLGRAIASAFVAAGGQVVVADVDAEAARAAADDLGEAARPVQLDVSDEASWISALDEVEKRIGKLDVLVNNAGIYAPNIKFEEMPIDLWRRHFAVNSDGVFLGCKHGILRMKQRGGAIVNIGSAFSITANPLGSAYCASKAAVLMTTRTAAASAGPYNVRVNAVLPGAVPTPMLMGNVTGDTSEADYLAALEELSPLGRLAQPQDVARAVVFLADAANGVITGSYLSVDGGNMPGA